MVAVLALVAGGLVALVASRSLVPSHPVPRVIGDTTAQAEAALRPLHFNLVVAGHAYSNQAAAPSCSRSPGEQLKQGKSVRVVLSLGLRPVPVPHVANLTEAQADAALKATGLRPAVRVKREASMTVAAGAVITSAPSGGTGPGQRGLAHGVDRKTSRPGTRTAGASAASYRGLGSHECQRPAADRNLRLQQHHPRRCGDLDPTATGDLGDDKLQVTVQVFRLGPHLVAVPFVHGDSVTSAAQNLEAQGFSVSGVSSGNPTSTVSGTSPSGGSEILYGSSVQIVTG